VGEFQGSIAIFSHGHFLRVLAARFLKWDVKQGDCFLLSVASVSILEYERDQPKILLWNETP
jgi:probable phosphoglycerate mutase